MKKVNFGLIILIAIFLMGCASAPVPLETLSPVAFLSFSSNVNVPYELDQVRDDEYGTEDGMLSNAVNRWFGRDNPEILTAPDRLEYANEQFARALRENAGIEVIDKDTVINSKEYSAIGEGILGYTDVKLRGADYKSIDSIGSKKARLLAREIGANSLLFVTFTFKKQLVKGHKLSGQIAAIAKMNVVAYDANGKDVINDDFETKSFQTIEVSKLDYDKDELVQLFPELIDILINQFIMKYL